MYTLVDEKISINDRNIHYKVKSPTKGLNNRPYLLCVQGGPGFSSRSMEVVMADLEKEAAKLSLPMPNLIFFDPVGCGQSDKAEDVAAEYTMQNYSEIAARVIEHVKGKFSPNSVMDLRICGGSFGGMSVMDLPVRRPQWLDENANVRLREIVAIVAPNGVGNTEYTYKFVEDNFADHPDYQQIRDNLEMLFDGKFANQDDYLRFVFALAPLYSNELEKTRNSFIGKFLMKHPHGSISAMKFLNGIFNSDTLGMMIEGLSGCSLDVMNQFAKTNFSGFNMIQQVSEHRDLYAKIPICMIACSKDHMANPQVSRDIAALLPDSCAAIILKDKHQAHSGPAREVFSKILLGVICDSHIPESVLDHSEVESKCVSENFNKRLRKLKSPLAVKNSTVRTFSALSIDGIVAQQVTLPDVPVAAEKDEMLSDVSVLEQREVFSRKKTC